MTVLHGIQTIFTFIVVLSILVVAHEWGHFIVARLFGIRVDDFSIGFGKRLIRLGRRGDTEYNIRMLPLGGFVKIAGMEADEEPLLVAKEKITGKERERENSDDPDATQVPLLAENTPEGVPYTAPDGFNAKPLWQRSLVIFAGPLMSFVLGYILLCLMGWTTGLPTGKTTNRVEQVEPGGEGQRIGLRTGDVITGITKNGVFTPITDGRKMVFLIHSSLNQPLILQIRRGSKNITLPATPGVGIDQFGKTITTVDVIQPGPALSTFGVRPGDALRGIENAPIETAADLQNALKKYAGKPVELDIARQEEIVVLKGQLPADILQKMPTVNAHSVGGLRFSPMAEIQHLSFRDSVVRGNYLVVSIFQTLGELVQRHQLQKSAGGVITMVQATSHAVDTGPFEVLGLMAQLSISLAIFNLLPIPVLDGGHLLAFFIEWLRRGKKMTEQQQQAFMLTGLAIIGVLFVLIMTNDILRTLRHQVPQ